MMRTEKDKMLARELYDPGAPEIQTDLAATQRWLARYNAALEMTAFRAAQAIGGAPRRCRRRRRDPAAAPIATGASTFASVTAGS
jgi:hypothetical protein